MPDPTLRTWQPIQRHNLPINPLGFLGRDFELKNRTVHFCAVRSCGLAGLQRYRACKLLVPLGNPVANRFEDFGWFQEGSFRVTSKASNRLSYRGLNFVGSRPDAAMATSESS